MSLVIVGVVLTAMVNLGAFIAIIIFIPFMDAEMLKVACPGLRE